MRSVLPSVPGVPWWGAVLIAAGCTALGALIDLTLNASLGLIYNLLFVLGCLLAALAVRQRALFTAAVQPPLVTLGIGMASLYFAALARSGSGRPQGMRRMVLNIALPFSNLFPWILTAFLLTLAVVGYRYFSTRTAAQQGDRSHGAAGRPSGTSARRGEKPARPDREPARSGRTPDRPAAGPEQRSGTARGRAGRAAGTAAAGRPAARTAASAPQTERPRTPADPRRRSPQPRDVPAAPPQAAPADGPRYVEQTAPTPVADLPPMEVTGPGTAPPPAPPLRRAQPQVIPPRPAGERPRRTAQEELRQRISIEDFIAGQD